MWPCRSHLGPRCGHLGAVLGLLGAEIRQYLAILEALVANLVASLRLKRRKRAKIVGITRRCRLYRNLQGFVQVAEGILELCWTKLEVSGAILGALGGHLGAKLEVSAVIFGILELMLDVISVLARLSVAMSKPSWAMLGPPWGCLGHSWSQDKAIFGHFGGFGCELGR